METCLKSCSLYANNLIDSLVLHQILSNPRSSPELAQFLKDIVHNETDHLLQELNEKTTVVNAKADQLRRESETIKELEAKHRETIEAHTKDFIKQTEEIKRLHAAHAAETQGLHAEYTEKLRKAQQLSYLETKKPALSPLESQF
jgi:iron-sulfur cluster repair protein YtfE (RIC family)